jgi:NAD(P)-dependent dehydrogenase (short-subunit alcohol dehydrogenase family)
MADRTILIYGGTGGIGSAIARAVRGRGDRVHLVGRTEETLAALASELDATFTVGDVGDDPLFARVAEDAGTPLSGLVYAIGTIHLQSLRRLTAEGGASDFRTNALGAALAVQSALSALKKSPTPASVVLFSSVAVSQGFAMHASMGMAKGAVCGLTVSLAAELAPGIRVNAIAPSVVETPLVAPLLASEATVAALQQSHPLQRLGTPDDVAALAAFLLSDDAGWITGQILGVDGGRSSLRPKG